MKNPPKHNVQNGLASSTLLDSRLIRNNENINIEKIQRKRDSDTENSDIDKEFSLKKSVEETKNLIALHNLTPTNLIKTLNLEYLCMNMRMVMKSRGRIS